MGYLNIPSDTIFSVAVSVAAQMRSTVVALVLGCLVSASAFVRPQLPRPPCSWSSRKASNRPQQYQTTQQRRFQGSKMLPTRVREAALSSWGAWAWRWALLLIPLGATGLGGGYARAVDEKGVKLFEDNCSSCHVGGGNVIGYARGKTLKSDALKKNKLDTRDSIVELLKQGKGVMPRYSAYTRKNGDQVPARLSDNEMKVVADFVLEQASKGWQ